MKKSLVFFLCLLLLPVSANAEKARYKFDPVHTQILFFVDHLGFSKSAGEFLEYSGTIQFDQENPDDGMVEVEIMTDSIDMDDAKWEKHLRGEDFFNTEEYPSMTFKSTAIEVTGDNTAEITGDLTMLGQTNPVVLDTTFNKAGEHPKSGDYVAGFSATTSVKRSDFGMDYGLPGIGDMVEIRLEVEAIREDQQSED